MNIHVPQGLEAQTELKFLSSVNSNMISCQSSKRNIAVVQDSLLGAYRMTTGKIKVSKEIFFNIMTKTDLETVEITKKIKHIRTVLKSMGREPNCYTGKNLVSMILPNDFYYEKKTDASTSEPVVKIVKGVLLEGTINKKTIGSAHNSVIHTLVNDYDLDTAANFVNRIQWITNEWLTHSGFTVSLKDCLITGKNKNIKKQQIKDTIQKYYIEAEGIKTSTKNPEIAEVRISGSLGKAKDIGLRIAKDSLRIDNNFLSTVNSGSKGDFFNIAQITGLLGQQNLKAKRVPKFLNNGQRTLPHYPFKNINPSMEYESRGFIASSFIQGLNPREFYFHAMAGREGISDTAMGTATSGYIQRRIVKLTEDIKVEYDGTVRDATGKIYQFSYGGDSLDPFKTVNIKGKPEPMNIDRIINSLNLEHENN